MRNVTGLGVGFNKWSFMKHFLTLQDGTLSLKMQCKFDKIPLCWPLSLNQVHHLEDYKISQVLHEASFSEDLSIVIGKFMFLSKYFQAQNFFFQSG